MLYPLSYEGGTSAVSTSGSSRGSLDGPATVTAEACPPLDLAGCEGAGWICGLLGFSRQAPRVASEPGL